MQQKNLITHYWLRCQQTRKIKNLHYADKDIDVQKAMLKELNAKQKRAYYNQRKYAKIKANPHLYAKHLESSRNSVIKRKLRKNNECD